jgi:hypothetical protein
MSECYHMWLNMRYLFAISGSIKCNLYKFIVFLVV